jgi:hypothetical protein
LRMHKSRSRATPGHATLSRCLGPPAKRRERPSGRAPKAAGCRSDRKRTSGLQVALECAKLTGDVAPDPEGEDRLQHPRQRLPLKRADLGEPRWNDRLRTPTHPLDFGLCRSVPSRASQSPTRANQREPPSLVDRSESWLMTRVDPGAGRRGAARGIQR